MKPTDPRMDIPHKLYENEILWSYLYALDHILAEIVACLESVDLGRDKKGLHPVDWEEKRGKIPKKIPLRSI